MENILVVESGPKLTTTVESWSPCVGGKGRPRNSRRIGSGRKLIGPKLLKGSNCEPPRPLKGEREGCGWGCCWRRHWHLQQRSSGLRKRQRLRQRRTPGQRKASPPHRHLRHPSMVSAVTQPGGQPKGCCRAHQGGVPGSEGGNLAGVRRGGGRGSLLRGRGRPSDGGPKPPYEGVKPR